MFMETIYFILAALCVVTVTTVVTLVTVNGVVRIFSSVSKLRETIGEVKQSLDYEIRGTHSEFNDSIKDVELSIKDVHHRIDAVERELNSSIDSRYDKLLNVLKK
jgi:low affinity Fe/Cu permease